LSGTRIEGGTVPTVLVVDDDDNVRQTLAERLETSGYEVLLARDGRDAFEVIARGVNPDVILLDVVMPIMDGWHFLSARLRDPSIVAVPVVLMSGGQEAERQSHKIGVCGFIRKPLDIGDLVDRINACLGRRRTE
jgi:DNA-binding response OmpR family regulator